MPVFSRASLVAVAIAALAACSDSTATSSNIVAPGFDVTVATAECQPLIDSLRVSASTVSISGKNAEKDRAALTSTLDAATTELAKGKNADAVTKLENFKTKVAQLLTAGRISQADADSLTAGAESAIVCIRSNP